MTFDPKHFFELAKQLFDDLKYNEDARYRTSISRALIDALKRKNKHIGEMLSNLRQKRNWAD